MACGWWEKQELAVELGSAGKWVVPSGGEIELPRQAQQRGPCFRTMESRDRNFLRRVTRSELLVCF